MVSYQQKPDTFRIKLGLLLEGRGEDLEAALKKLKNYQGVRVIYEKLSTNSLTIIEKNGGGRGA